MRQIALIFILCLFGINSFSQEHVIYFEFDKSDINKQQVLELEKELKSNEISKIFLYGYTDTVGTIQYNQILANKRIEAVKNLIKNQKGDIEILSTNYGEKESDSPLDKENRKVVIKYEVGKYSMIERTYNSPEIFQIDNSNDTIINCKQGTEIYIPKNCFVLVNDNPLASEHIEFRVTEYYSPVDMIAAKLTTQSDNEILETGGMLYLEAYSENTKCVLNNKKRIGIKFKDISEKDSMQIFYGEQLDNEVNWKLSSNEPIDIFEFEELEEKEVFFVVENMPAFNGGDISAFRSYVYENLKYPVIAIENEIQGSVFVQFDIDVTGFLVNPVIVRGVDPALDFEVLRVVNSSPQWIPGTQRGRPVSVRHTIRINFVMDNGLPIDENNRITSYSEFDNYVESDSVIQQRVETSEFISEFYLWTSKLKWINCDKFYRSLSKSDVKIKVNSSYEIIYALFNSNRSILSPNVYDSENQIKGFRNLPSNQEILFVGIKIQNGITYFTSLKMKPSSKVVEPVYKQLDKNRLKEELKRIGL